VKLIEKVVKSGIAYVESEIARLNRLLDGSVTAAKRDEFTVRVNILRSFLSAPKKEEASAGEQAETSGEKTETA